MMRIIVTLVILSFYFTPITAQKPYALDPALDVYGIEVAFKGKVLTDKCDCCCSVNPQSKKCTLYEIEINEVFLQRDSAIYKDTEALKSVKYMILPHTTKQEEVSFDTVYAVFAYNSCSDKLLVVNQLLTYRPNPMPKYSGLAFVTGLTICKKFAFFQKVLLALGINREKIYEKAKNIPPSNSKFVKALDHTN